MLGEMFDRVIHVLENLDLFDSADVYLLYSAGVIFSKSYLQRNAILALQTCSKQSTHSFYKLPTSLEQITSNFEDNRYVTTLDRGFLVRHFIHRICLLKCLLDNHKICYYCKARIRSNKVFKPKFYNEWCRYTVLKENYSYARKEYRMRNVLFDSREICYFDGEHVNIFTLDSDHCFDICQTCVQGYMFTSIASYCKFKGFKKINSIQRLLESYPDYIIKTSRGFYSPIKVLHFLDQFEDLKFRLLRL